MVCIGLAKKVHLGFSTMFFGKTRTHFFASLISGDVYRNTKVYLMGFKDSTEKAKSRPFLPSEYYNSVVVLACG